MGGWACAPFALVVPNDLDVHGSTVGRSPAPFDDRNDQDEGHDSEDAQEHPTTRTQPMSHLRRLSCSSGLRMVLVPNRTSPSYWLWRRHLSAMFPTVAGPSKAYGWMWWSSRKL